MRRPTFVATMTGAAVALTVIGVGLSLVKAHGNGWPWWFHGAVIALVAGLLAAILTRLQVRGSSLHRKNETLEQNQEQLERKEAELRTIVNNLSEGLYVCDSSGRPLLVNDAFYAFYPFKEPLHAQSFYEAVELFDPSGQPLPVEDWPVSRALRGEQVHGLELRIRFKSNPEAEFIHRYNASPVRDAQGNVIMALFTAEDITLRKQTEEALIRSEKLAVTGRMAATIAHEVNNPLEGALNAVYIASSNPAQAPKMLALAEQELRRAAHITQQTVGFYRDTGSRTPVVLPQLIDEVLGVYERKLQTRNIRVQRRFKCGPCNEGCSACFLINVGELRQIISNLLANGMDAVSDNGELHIRVSRVTSPGRDGQNIYLTIADNGSGIRVENLKRIFEPFFTTKESVGTGLGLWVTQELVRKHNGTIKLRSRKDKGTVFRLSFPALPSSSAAEPELGKTLIATERKQPRTSIIETLRASQTVYPASVSSATIRECDRSVR